MNKTMVKKIMNLKQNFKNNVNSTVNGWHTSSYNGISVHWNDEESLNHAAIIHATGAIPIHSKSVHGPLIGLKFNDWIEDDTYEEGGYTDSYEIYFNKTERYVLKLAGF